MIRRLVLLASSIALLASAAAACGGSDSKSARIRSFTASPSLLPTLGGTVTLTWDVRGAESVSIEPGVGVVTGSSHTLTVTQDTEFTLTAKRDGRRKRSHASVKLAPPGAVAGHVRTNPSREALANVAVYLNGEATQTDADGNFLFVDVPTPYDVALFSPDFGFAMIWEGLTRPDPILEIPVASGVTFGQDIGGSATPGSGAANTTTQIYFKNEFSLFPSGTTPDLAGVYTGSTQWPSVMGNGTPADTAVLGLRFVTDPGTSEITFTHFGRTDVIADPNGSPIAGADFTLAPVGTAAVNGTFLLDDFENLAFVYPTFLVDSASGSTADVGFPLPSTALVVTTNLDFTLNAPDITGSNVVIWAAYADAFGGQGIRAVRLPVGAIDAQVDFPSPPHALTPVQNGVVDRETIFQISSLSDTAKIWSFQSNDATVLVMTTRDRMTLPEIPEAGIVFYNDDFSWNVVEISPFPGDDLAGPAGLFGAAPELFGFTQPSDAFLTGGQDPPPILIF